MENMGQNNGRAVAAEKNPNNTYDVILRCKPSDLCNDGHWEVEFPAGTAGEGVLKTTTQTSTVAIGILGNFNRGKTWIMSRLCHCDLPDQGMTMKTEGLSLKWVEPSDESPEGYVIIDSAGINSPIDLLEETADEERKAELEPGETGNLGELFQKFKRERLAEGSTKRRFLGEFFTRKAQESAQYEDFLQTMTLQLCDCIIVVINETTYLDQIFLHKVVKKWLTLCTTDSCPDRLRRDNGVYVIHNFLRTTDPKERDRLFRNSTVKLYPGQLEKKGSAFRFACTHENFRTHHVCLMCDDDDSGRAYNDKVFALLKNWMESRVDQCGSKGLGPLVERFSSCASTALTRGYVQNLKEIIPQTVDNILTFQAVKENDDYPLKAVTTMEDRIYGAMEGFVPPVTVSTYVSKSGKRCKLIYLEMPGVIESSIKLEQTYESSDPGCSAVQIRATKEKIDPIAYLTESESLSEDDAGIIPHEEKPDLGEEADTCRYGEICKMFQIPLAFDANGTIIWGRAGTVYLVFEEKKPKTPRILKGGKH